MKETRMKAETKCGTCGKAYNPSNLPLSMALMNARLDVDKCKDCHKDDSLRQRPFDGLKAMMEASNG